MNLTNEQRQILEHLIFYAEKSSEEKSLFILQGKAGTGKTTLLKFFLDYLKNKGYSYLFLAPTGKAARNASQKTQHECHTIHKKLYNYVQKGEIVTEKNRQQELKIKEYISIKEEFKTNQPAFIIIDEASMLSDDPPKKDCSDKYKKYTNCSGFTLRDIIENTYPNTKLLFVGDKYQLPPIGTDIFAFNQNYIRQRYKINLIQYDELVQVQRYKSRNLKTLSENIIDHIKTKKIPNNYITVIDNAHVANENSVYEKIKQETDFLEKYVQLFEQNKSVIAITHKNKTVTSINQRIRMAMKYKDELQNNEVLMIVKNNYMYDLMNGDIIRVINVEKINEEKFRVFRKGKIMTVGVPVYHVEAIYNEFYLAQPYEDDASHKASASSQKKTIYPIIFNQEIEIEPGFSLATNEILLQDFHIRYGKLFRAIKIKNLVKNTESHETSLFDENEHTTSDWAYTDNPSLNSQEEINESTIKAIYDIIYDDNKLENTPLDILYYYLGILYKIDKKVNYALTEYGYATTCNKAQGSEWDTVFICEYYNNFKNLNSLNWLYTAVTRTTSNLYYCDAGINFSNVPHLPQKNYIHIDANYTDYIRDIEFHKIDFNANKIYLINRDNIYVIPISMANKLLDETEKESFRYPFGLFIHNGEIQNVVFN